MTRRTVVLGVHIPRVPHQNRATIVRGATFLEYRPSLGIMSAMALFLFCVCALRFRKKIG